MSEHSEQLWQVRGLIPDGILSLLPSCWCFSFALERGVSFFHGIQYSPVDSSLAVTCSFGVITGEMSTRPSTCHLTPLLIANFRLRLKRVGKTTRPLRYDLKQIPYNYIVEVTNRVKGLDLKNYTRRFVTLYRRQ